MKNSCFETENTGKKGTSSGVSTETLIRLTLIDKLKFSRLKKELRTAQTKSSAL